MGIEEAQKKLADTQNQILEAITERGAPASSPAARTDLLAASIGSRTTLAQPLEANLQTRDSASSPSLRHSGLVSHPELPAPALHGQCTASFPWEQLGPRTEPFAVLGRPNTLPPGPMSEVDYLPGTL